VVTTRLNPGATGLVIESWTLSALSQTAPVGGGAAVDGGPGSGRVGDHRAAAEGPDVAVSAEALFTLTDLCGLTPEQAIASATRTARTLTTAAIAG
jgi:hypothetical protein